MNYYDTELEATNYANSYPEKDYHDLQHAFIAGVMSFNNYLSKNGWQPLSTAPKDGTTIEVYWFASSRFVHVYWDAENNCWDAVYFDFKIPDHIKKAVWRPVIHLDYNDYRNLF